MALNIKDQETDRLAGEVAAMTGESKARAVKIALEERRARLVHEAQREGRAARLQRVLEEEIWPLIPPEELDQPPLSREEEDEILGYGPEGF